ncbi:MAG: BTAD domain-containing putative transcriptional regulator [Mycobacteriales bacterium]
MAPEQGLRVHLFGGLEVEGVPALSIGSRKARAVLRRLAVARGAAVHVADLIDVAWPDGATVRGGEQLAVIVSRLRGTLGAERLPRRDAGYALVADWLDVAALDAGLRSCIDDVAAGRTERAVQTGRASLALVRGPLLPEDPDAPWLEDERASIARSVGRLQLVTAEAALATGSAWEAADLAQRYLDMEPFDEAALRLLMVSLAACGRTAAALTAYHAAAQLLAAELGTDPAAETQQLHLSLLRADSRPTPIRAAATPPPGRSAEVALLLDAVRRDGPALAVLEGPGGIGKTTVLEHVAQAAAGEGAVVLRAAGNRIGGALPLQPVLDALTVAVRALPAVDRTAALGADADVLAGVLRLDGDTTTPASTAATLVAGSGRPLLFAALEGLLGRLGRVLLVLDDGHEADTATAELLHHCTRQASPGSITVIVARRPGAGPPWRGDPHLVLSTLDRDAVAEVVGEARADELWEISGGHPLFLTELARHQHGALPGTVLDAVAERCAGTGDVATTLRAAAVLGTDVDVALLAEVLREDAATVLSRLEEGVRQQLLVESGHGFAFAHKMFRDAFDAGVSSARRTLLHQAATDALAGRSRVDPLLLAHHALGAADPVRASAALTRAAEIAAERYAHEEALALLDRAVALDDSVVVRLARARAQLLLGRYAEADEDAAGALRLGAGAAGLEAAAQIAYYRRDLDTSLRLAEQAAAESTDPEIAAACLALAGRIMLGRGRLEEATTRLSEAQDLATGPVRAFAAVWLSLTLVSQGPSVQAYDLARGSDAVRAQGHPLLEPHRGLALGRALAMLGRPAQALAAFDQLARTVERQHVTRFVGRAENFRGWVLRNLGASEEADDATQQAWDAVSRLDDSGVAEARGHAMLDLADGRLRRGDLDGAARWLDEASHADLAPHVMRWRFELRRDLTLSRLSLAAGDPGRAEEHARAVLEQSRRIGVPRFDVQAGLLLARAAQELGRDVDLEAVGQLAGALPEVAPLECWWQLADLARAFGVDAWSRLAAERVAALVAEAGPWGDGLRAAASVTLADLPG